MELASSSKKFPKNGWADIFFKGSPEIRFRGQGNQTRNNKNNHKLTKTVPKTVPKKFPKQLQKQFLKSSRKHFQKVPENSS
jgi:hypothetical protein